MTSDNPRVSIGLAVYNGEDYLEQAIDSILAQSYQDYELIISDNASTDETENICKCYVEKDARIHYYRNPVNIGGANNENRTFELSKGEFFRWAAHDDYLDPELISRCVEILDANPTVVLCYTSVTQVDERNNVMNIITPDEGTSEDIATRFRELSAEDHHCEATYGLVRADIMRKTQLQKNYTGSDRTYLCELSLYGKFHVIPEPLFFKRYHAQNLYVNMRARMAWFNPMLKGKIVFPYWMQLLDYLGVITRTPIALLDKLRCHGVMIVWLLKHLRNLAGDLVFALLALLRPSRDPYRWRNEDKDAYNWE